VQLAIVPNGELFTAVLAPLAPQIWGEPVQNPPA